MITDRIGLHSVLLPLLIGLVVRYTINLPFLFITLTARRRSSCLIPMDIAFLLDSSNSAGKVGFQREKEFVKLVSSTLAMSRTGTRVGIISYSARANLVVAFQEYSSAEILQSTIDELQFMGGTPRIETALDVAVTGLFTLDGGARPGIPKVAVLLTEVSESNITEYETLREAAAPFKAAGVAVIAVGVGPDADLQDLRVLVGNEEYILGTESFESLGDLVEDVTQLACKAAGKEILTSGDTLLYIM